MSKLGRNNYISLKKYNKTNENYSYSYVQLDTDYAKDESKKGDVGYLTNYSSSGVVATNPSAYNVAIEAPGLSWI